MSTKTAAFACVLSVCLLFSCNNKKGKTNRIASLVDTASLMDTVDVLPDDFFDLQQYFTGFTENMAQKFTVPDKNVSVITASKGLRITINPSALELEDGSPVEGKINVSIIELTTSNDLFKSNAATVSNGRLLASGGSYFIGMENNGQKVKLKEGRTLQVDFPVLKKEEMELFYGERDTAGTMNWVKAGDKLEQEFETIGFNMYSSYEPITRKPVLRSKYHLFNKPDEKVVFNGKKMTLTEMVAEFKKRGIDKFIDTLYYSWYGGKDIIYSYEQRIDDSAYRSGMQYRLISSEELCKEKEETAAANAGYEKAIEEQKNNQVTTQLKKYYAPAAIGSLGWINCDRFYNNKDNIDVELDIPITLNQSQVEYFIIFKSFNGLLNKKLKFTAETKVILEKLPVGEAVTLVAFAKNKGVVYHGKEDFIIGRDKKTAVEFNTITPEELGSMFGKNVRI